MLIKTLLNLERANPTNINEEKTIDLFNMIDYQFFRIVCISDGNVNVNLLFSNNGSSWTTFQNISFTPGFQKSNVFIANARYLKVKINCNVSYINLAIIFSKTESDLLSSDDGNQTPQTGLNRFLIIDINNGYVGHLLETNLDASNITNITPLYMNANPENTNRYRIYDGNNNLITENYIKGSNVNNGYSGSHNELFLFMTGRTVAIFLNANVIILYPDNNLKFQSVVSKILISSDYTIMRLIRNTSQSNTIGFSFAEMPNYDIMYEYEVNRYRITRLII
ncbi:MAG: hypothetical protein RMJ67_01245 [Elusimicrobiota bacterium]|nr:hypothetical protein [Endomicrobiia bacterium]MDW8165129.1 hypothetical protein [Elusimicrobiota bacterium]